MTRGAGVTGVTRKVVASRLGTEFGEALRTMLERTPGAFAGVVSDDQGLAIDYAHVPSRIDGIDVQLLGAQFGLPLFRLNETAAGQGITAPLLMLETSTHSLVASPVSDAFIVVMLLDHRANLGLALAAFARSRDTLGALLA